MMKTCRSGLSPGNLPHSDNPTEKHNKQNEPRQKGRPRRPSAHASAGLRADHQHRLGAWAVAHAVWRALHRDEARDRGLFRIARPCVAYKGHPGFGHRAGIHEHTLRCEFPAARRQLDAYSEARAAISKRVKEVLATADHPRVVAEVVLKAAGAAHPRLRYTAGGLAGRLAWLRRLAPSKVMDAGIRKDLRLDTVRGARS